MLGRLIHASSPHGNAVHYNYDAVGNITAIRRGDGGALSVLDFEPVTGPVGTSVTVFGSGFRTNPAQNTVTFNGAAGAVSTASETALTVTVPAGATSGKISVNNDIGSATSTSDFLIGSTSPAPVITSFSPQIGTLNTVVTLVGTNFQAEPADDKVAVAGEPATLVRDPTSPTVSQLRFRVPSAKASGTISLTTQFGRAVSAAEFFAVPSTVAPADVEFTGRLAINGPPATVTTTANGKKAMLLFEGAAGQGLHLRTQGGNFAGPLSAAVFAPDGLLIESLSLTNDSVADFTKLIPLTGTYSVIVSPGSTDKGNVQLAVVGDATGTLPLDTVTAMSLAVGQNARFAFSAVAGAGYGLGVTGLTLVPGGNSVQARLRKSDGTILASCAFNAAGSCDFPPASFGTSGTYLLDFDPPGLTAASLSVLLNNEVTGALTLDSAPAAVTTTRAGQNARYSFTGTAGQLVNVVLSGNALDDGAAGSNTTGVFVFKPSSPSVTPIGSLGINTATAGGTIDLTLPETGTYTLFITPDRLDSGTINAQVKSPLTGTLAVDGSTAISLSAGQNARFSFTAQANTGYGLAFPSIAFTPQSPANMQVVVRKADGTQVGSCGFNGPQSCDLSPSQFATTGTYLLDFDPGGLTAVSATVILSTDTGGALAVNGAPTVTTIERAGQNARYSFTGTAGQLVNVVLSGNVLDDGVPGNNITNVSVFKPSSPNVTPIGSLGINTATAGGTIDLTLPETGIYTLFITPDRLDSGTINAQVKTVLTGTLAVDDSTAISLSAGQNARFSFTAQANTGYGLAAAGLVLTPPAAASMQVLLRKPDGTHVGGCAFNAPQSCDLGPTLFATAGTYVLDFDPNLLAAASFTAMLSTDVNGTLTIGGPAAAVTLVRAGQNARYTFTGAVGQVVSVQVSNSTIDDGSPGSNTISVQLLGPTSPFPITSGGFGSGGQGVTVGATLPATGTYTVLVSPSGLDSGTFNLRVQ